MKNITAILIALFIFGIIWQPVVTATEAYENPYLSLSDFLDEMEIDINGYIAKVAQLAEIWQHPHYLEKNETRYEAYQTANPDIPYESIIAYVNVLLDKGHYTDVFGAQDLDEITVLINKTFHTVSTWSPGNLINIGTGHLMQEEAAEHINLMRTAMTDAGLKVHIISTYRAYSQQSSTFNNALANSGNREFTERNFARPGHSEHQTGLVVDMLQQPYVTNMQSARFQDSENFTWLTQNAHTYGFILRYPEAKQDIHGYIFEPWHWRYVGVDIATAMFDMEIALYEDFYGRYIASDVLHRMRELILVEHPAHIAQQEAERLAAEEEAARLAAEAEEAERLAAVAAAAEEEAQRQAEAEAARKEAEELAAAEAEEAARLAASAAEPAIYWLYIIPSLLIIALICTAISGSKAFKRKKHRDYIRSLKRK